MKLFNSNRAAHTRTGPTRRDLLAGGTALGFGMLGGGLLLPQMARAEPKRGGHAVFAIGNASTTDSFNPDVTLATFGGVARVTFLDSLYEINSTGEIVPVLVTDASVDDSATEWRLTLKKDVTFHNGKTLTAEDVVNSINLHRAEGSKSPVKSLLVNLEDISAEGDDVVVFKLSAPDVDWPSTLAEYTLSILPSKDGVADWQSGVGTGPYRLISFEPGVSARFERYENDHRSDRGWFDSVEYIAVNDGAARTNAIISGEVHVSSEIEPSLAMRLNNVPNVTVVSRTSPGFSLFDMQTALAPVDNVNVRRALKYAIDRQEFVDKILYGYGTVANDHPIAPTYQFHDPSLEQHSYDPDKAKFYLKEAGLDSLDLDLQVSTSAFTGAVDAALLYSETARAAGINLKPVRVPADGYWATTWAKTPFFGSYWTGRPTEAHIISLAYGKGAAWNATSYANDRLDRLVTEAKGQRDEAKRRELYAEAQRILSVDGPSVIPAFNNMIDAVSNEIGMPETNVTQASLDSRYAASRWWFV